MGPHGPGGRATGWPSGRAAVGRRAGGWRWAADGERSAGGGRRAAGGHPAGNGQQAGGVPALLPLLRAGGRPEMVAAAARAVGNLARDPPSASLLAEVLPALEL